MEALCLIFANKTGGFLKSKRRQNVIVMSVLVSVFAIYNTLIYTQESTSSVLTMSPYAQAGEQLYQKNNCAACHQIYGLGGYLGPDLTNVISQEHKGPEYVKSFVNSGTKSMPEFNFSEGEKEQLVAFLTHVDNTGYYPNKEAVIGKDGWVEIEYK